MSQEQELYPGRTFGRYELLVPLASGATASVWAARTTGSPLEKIVAVKAMLTEFSSDIESESMFLDEARLVSRIRHPNVATVLDLGEANDALYIVMEWVEGEPLQVLMREAGSKGGIPLPLAVRIVKQAAAGLQAAHEVCDDSGKTIGLVHRDVSPQNILVGYDGSVKVIDFGVAKATSNMQRTQVGQIKGKIPYMAPEQAIGDPVDRRTDIFALGVVLYQLVTGKHPFRGDNEFATLVKLRDARPVDPPSTLVSLPAELEKVIVKALAKNRDDRHASMSDLARALERAMPSAPDDAQVLGGFVRSFLSQRAAKKNHAIREALRAAGSKGRPVNLSTVFDDAATAAAFESSAANRIESASRPSTPLAAAALTATSPSAPAYVAPRMPASPSLPDGLDDDEVPFRDPRARVKLIAAGITLAVALAIAVWALTIEETPASTGGDTTAPRRSF